MTRRNVSRRTVLRGVGTALALPMLEIMGPLRRPAMAAQAASGAATVAPVRMAFLFVPNGVIMPRWTPATLGADYELPEILAPLANHKKNMLVLSGLAHDKAKANGDGAGDHARSSAAFLTGCQPRKTAGKDIQAGISIDQIAAEYLGRETRLPSLELGTVRGANAGNCDSGYSCAYSANISWKSPQTPMAKEVNPRAVFTRLFGDPDQVQTAREKARRIARQKSVLDLVREDAATLQKKLGQADQQKVDEYLDSVRSIEKRLEESEINSDTQVPDNFEIPTGVPRDLALHIRLMMDMMVLAFQTDSTRVTTFMYANEGDNRSFPWLDVRNGHHELSHHRGDAEKIEQIARIDKFYIEQFAYFLDRLSAVREGEGTLLDNSMILYGSAIGDGNRHNHDDLPVLLAGRAAGAIDPGRHVRYPKDTPMCNLFLNMLDNAGVPGVDRFGDSTGRVGQLMV